jgi:hypothetical protein
MEDIEGQIEDILYLPGATGTVPVHPIVFHHVLDQGPPLHDGKSSWHSAS